jgi:hypothetical protein
MVNYVETGHIPDTAELLAIACKRNALGQRKNPEANRSRAVSQKVMDRAAVTSASSTGGNPAQR